MTNDAFILIPYKKTLMTVVLDAEDYEKFKNVKWRIDNCSRHSASPKLYVRHNTTRGGKQITTYLHRVIKNALPGLVVDHDDGDTMNNRRSNLKIVTVDVNAKKQNHALQRKRGW